MASEELQAPALPDAEDIGAALEKAEREEEAREAWLASPGAVQRRQESRYAFSGLNATEAQELLRTVFAEQLARLNSDPTRFLSDAEIIHPLDQSVATVRENGDTSLMDAGAIPIRTADEGDDLSKVDLSLEPSAAGFDLANPLTEVSIPDKADEPIEIGERGIAVSGVGAEDKAALQFGDMNVFYPDALGADSGVDRLVSPIAGGVEIFDLFRSADSPEVIRFRLDLPQGAELRSDGNGGAKVIKGEESLASIPFPNAVDAQGTPVPVELTVEGDSIALHVAHREADLAYPLLVDPAISEDWYNYNWFNGHNHQALTNGSWSYTESHSWINSSTYCIYACWGVGRGLFVTMPGGAHWAQQYGQWTYSAPNANSYLANAWANPFVRDDHGCSKSSYPEPHDYLGMWHNNTWNRFLNDQAVTYGYSDIQSWGSTFILGLATGNGTNNPCWRDLAVGGAVIWLDDWQYPTISSASGIPTGWVSDATPITATVNASDSGLGVRRVTISPEGKPSITDNVDNCTGLAAARCPTSRSSQFKFTADSLGEGIRTLQASTEDPTGKAYGPYSMSSTKVDRTPPEVTLSGQLAQATDEGGSAEQPPGEGDELSLPVYNLKIDATDGALTNNLSKRSGVKSITVHLDGKEAPEQVWTQSCPGSSCSMSKTFTLKLAGLSAGEHVLKVLVSDQLLQPRLREIEFEYVPATGIKDEYVMHYFPLPNGQGNEAEEEHPARPELAVNVMNGNLVYREQDIEVEGPALDLEVERYYNSQLPSTENSEFGDGWTLAETPDLNPLDTGGSPAPDEAKLLSSSGAIEDGVELPIEAGAEKFDPSLQATLTKMAGGGYQLTDETGESATSVAFDDTGQTEALLTEGAARVDYTYQEGKLAEIEVKDPATVGVEDPSELEIPEPPLFAVPSFAYAFGVEGEGDGEFQAPADVAVGPEGDIWVVDADANRVQHFSRWGHYLDQFGSGGTGDGQLSYPVAIEIDQDGNLWVLDSYNDRVQKFNQQGEFLTKWGTYGSAPGQLNTPEGLAIDAEGNFWISDRWNGRIQKFTSSGTLLEVAGTSGEGDLNDPAGLAVGPDGEVFVADWAANRVLAFDKSGDYLRKFGSEGYGEGQFHHPVAVEVDTQGNVFVSDESDEELEQFDSDGNFIAQYGGEGEGDGEFEFSRPMGIVTDAEGGLWITDPSNNRVQRWTRDGYSPSHADTAGSSGVGNGQFDLPGDVDIDSDGDIWVVDTTNNRVQQLDSEGNFISKFGVLGSANGQLKRPSAIEIDTQGNIWVADAGNDRLQKFNQAGQYLAKFGSGGTANGKLDSPEGIAIDQSGDIWVSDTWNDRVQRFSPAGTFLKAFGTSGPGELYEPMGIDVVHGEVFVADLEHHRITVFDEAGEYLREFGEEGDGPGQFRYPNALEIDPGGNVWVADEGNERILQFNVEGEFVTAFGVEGTGEGEFELTSPSGIATDAEGGIWVTDSANDRLQRWELPGYVPTPEPQLTDADPAVEVDVISGLVGEVSGEEAGEHVYAHSGDDLTVHDGPDGETKYEYNAAGRMTKVTLPNGTLAQMTYNVIYGRVSSVTVDPAGSEPAKKTEFAFSDEPRRTTVIPPDAPHVIYDIGADGSVLKWWNVQQPPVFDDIAGTLYDNRETATPITSGDHNLTIQAHSEEGIASIDVIANGDQLIDEETCEQTEAPGIECKTVLNEWVTATELHSPGHLQLEALITDRLGNSASERFWVNIPEPPPPPAPGNPVPPKFAEIAQFREEYGLEVVFPVASEIELNERIFNLINAWYNPQSPAGEVARASWERWGVPLRPADVAELEYRERYLKHNTPLISQWGLSNSPSTYAGFYMDHRAGGKIQVGFTSNQVAQVATLEQQAGIDPDDRIVPFLSQPTRSLTELEAISQSFDEGISSRPDLMQLLTTGKLDIQTNSVSVGATNVTPVKSFIATTFGSNPGITAYFAPSKPVLRKTFLEEGVRVREMNNRLYAGDWIRTGLLDGGCTLAFGAWEISGAKPNGTPTFSNYALTAGHCYPIDTVLKRGGYEVKEGKRVEALTKAIGKVERRSYTINIAGFTTDAEAIRLHSATELPRWLYWSPGYQFKINGVANWTPGMTLCHSGTWGGTHCGPTAASLIKSYYEGAAGPVWQIRVFDYSIGGDSGSPVFDPMTGSAVGLLSGGPFYNQGPTDITPLLSLEGKPYAQEVLPGTAPGGLAAPGMKSPHPLNIVDVG
jgi:tripartite motif-containing protein 71